MSCDGLFAGRGPISPDLPDPLTNQAAPEYRRSYAVEGFDSEAPGKELLRKSLPLKLDTRKPEPALTVKITEIADFAALGERPVPGGSPAGEDARYAPEYAAVLAEIEKLSFSGQGDTASWPLIEEQAAAVLSNTSKDITMAAYLAVALCHNRGFAGMLAGVRLLSGLLTRFWETAWPPPKRMRGRINALDWWHERVLAFVREQAANAVPLSAELRKSLPQALAALEATASSRMPEAASLQNVIEAVRNLPAPGSASAERRTPDAQSAPEPGAPAEPEENATADDAVALRRRFVAAAQAYLAAARRAEPADARLWRLSRLVLWSAVTALPPAENKQTLLPAPDMEVLARARQKLEAGNALEAAFIAEDFFATAPFCLDAQAFIGKALSGLGPRFAEAAQAVQEECARFAADLPGLETLRFSDDSPFASPQTAAWLQETARAAHADEKPAVPEASRASAPVRRLEEARELLAQNRLPQALDLLDAAKTDSPSENLRFRTAQLRLLCEAGKGDAALALAEALLAETADRDLDNWDPGLALEVLTVARSALILFGDTQHRPGATRRIARLRPSAALE
jgi:type VI secretion system protein VasJ